MDSEKKRHIGEAVVLILYFIVDAFEVWPVSHSIALLIAVGGVSAILFAETPIRWWGISTVGMMFVALVTYEIIGPIPDPLALPYIGWLQPDDQPTPTNGCSNGPFADRLGNSPVVLVGSLAFAPHALQSYRAVILGQCNAVSLDVGPNGLSVSADIYAPDGTSLGNIRNNRYDVTGEKHLVVEHSGDLSTLVVHDASNQELLWVKFLNPKAIRIRGIFSCPVPRLQTITATDESLTVPGHNTISGGCIAGGESGVLIR